MNEEIMGIDPSIKDRINNEGWEDNAALIIGKKEELGGKLEKLEKEGQCSDVISYIRLNKHIEVPESDTPKNLSQLKGTGWFLHDTLFFIDSSGNIAKVNFDYNKISSMENTSKFDNGFRRKAVSELEKHGMNFESSNSDNFRHARTFIDANREKTERMTMEKKKLEFDL